MEIVLGGLMGLFALYIFVMMFINLGKAIWSCFDHTTWAQDAAPDPEAVIVDIKSQQVKYVKNGAKFKTTVQFSDGFTFVTHKTNRENHFGSYTISVDRKEIARIAKTSHELAVAKKGVKAVPAPAPVIPEATPENYPATAPVTKPQPAAEDYPATAPVTKPQPAAEDYPATAPVTKPRPAAEDYPATAPVTKPQPAAEDYPATAPVSKPQPAVVISAVEKAMPAADDYPKTAPVSQPEAAQDYPATAPVSDFKSAVIITPAADPVPETTRWICPKCGLVHNKALIVCFHCGTPQSSATKFV